MKRTTSILPVYALTLALAAPLWAGGNFKPADAKALDVRIVSEPSGYDQPMQRPGAVIQAEARCSKLVPRGIEVTLRWEVTLEGAKAHRVDLTEFRDGFAKGRFLTSGERPLGERSLPFEEASPGLYYYWRVLTSTDAGWVVSATGRFDAPVCASDIEDGE